MISQHFIPNAASEIIPKLQIRKSCTFQIFSRLPIFKNPNSLWEVRLTLTCHFLHFPDRFLCFPSIIAPSPVISKHFRTTRQFSVGKISFSLSRLFLSSASYHEFLHLSTKLLPIIGSPETVLSIMCAAQIFSNRIKRSLFYGGDYFICVANETTNTTCNIVMSLFVFLKRAFFIYLNIPLSTNTELAQGIQYMPAEFNYMCMKFKAAWGRLFVYFRLKFEEPQWEHLFKERHI